MQRSDSEWIRSLPIFARLSPKATSTLSQCAALLEVPAKTVLLREGESPDALFVLIDGLVHLFTALEGHEVTVLVLKPVTCFVTAPILCNSVLFASARTIQPSRLVSIRARTARVLFAKDHSFARAITNDLSQSYLDIVLELKNMRARTGFERLVAWILAMQAQSENPLEIDLPYDKGLLAARLGMVPETLSRDLARLAHVGVTVHGRKLRISKDNTLRRFASVDDLSRPSTP